MLQLQHTATHCNTLQLTLQHAATHCNTLQRTATHCNTLQHTATHCNTQVLLFNARTENEGIYTLQLRTHDGVVNTVGMCCSVLQRIADC